VSSLLKGSILIGAGTIYKIVLSLLIDKFLATQLGVESFGRYKYGVTIVLMLSTLCTLGLGSSIIRSIAIQDSFLKKKKLISTSLVLVLLIAVFIIIFTLTQEGLFGVDSIFLFATIFFSFNTLFNSIYSGLEKPNLKVLINDLFGFTTYLIFLWLYFRFNGELSQVSIIYFAYCLVVFMVNLISSRKFYAKFNNNYILSDDFKEYIMYSTPLFGVSILIMLSGNLDKVILNFFVTEKQLGIYYAVFNISNLLPLILSILVFLYLPRMSNFLKDKKLNKATLLSSYFSKWTMIAASIILGIIFFYTEDILKLLYTDEFVEGISVLKILSLGQWVNVSLGFTGQNLLALGDSKSQLYIRITSFILGATLLYFGARYYGSFGAATSILIALVCSNVLQIVVLKTKHNFVGYRKQNLYTLLVIVFGGVILSQLHKVSWVKDFSIFVLMIIDFSIFVLLLILTKVINQKDIRVLKLTDVK
tara:strand:- start:6594 stop:8021 length:1428 start_codon:yes stop_codon:yes gene_type:complete